MALPNSPASPEMLGAAPVLAAGPSAPVLPAGRAAPALLVLGLAGAPWLAPFLVPGRAQGVKNRVECSLGGRSTHSMAACTCLRPRSHLLPRLRPLLGGKRGPSHRSHRRCKPGRFLLVLLPAEAARVLLLWWQLLVQPLHSHGFQMLSWERQQPSLQVLCGHQAQLQLKNDTSFEIN